VEVIRDAFENSGSEGMSAVKATFSVAENAIREEVMRYIGTFSGRNPLERTKSRPSMEKPALEAPPDVDESSVIVPHGDANHDDDDQWEDEPDSDRSSQQSQAKGREHSPRPVSPPSTLRSRRSGRSTSIRRTALGTARSSRRVSRESTPPEPLSPVSPIQRDRSGIAFERTDSINSVRSGDRVNMLRGTEAPQVRSRDPSPSRGGIRFAAELSRPPSRSGSPAPGHHHHSLPYAHSGHDTPTSAPNTQRGSALKPLPKR
jgi:hypothetical protein